MGKDTDIQWADSTVNASTGCGGCELWTAAKASEPYGRRTCYAGPMHEGRLHHSLPHLYGADFTEVRLAPGRMVKAAGYSDLRGKSRPGKPWLDGLPRIIFVGDMGDMFSKEVPFEYIKSEFIDVAMSPKGSRHIWMTLTKRASRIAEFGLWLDETHGIKWPENVWAGTSITGPTTENRAEILAYCPAPVKFLSVEPLIAPVNFAINLLRNYQLVIVGGESGPNARPFDLEWVRSIRDRCKAAGVACLVKQLGARPIESEPDDGPEWPVPMEHDNRGNIVPMLRDSHGGDWDEWPADLRIREFPTVEKSHV